MVQFITNLIYLEQQTKSVRERSTRYNIGPINYSNYIITPLLDILSHARVEDGWRGECVAADFTGAQGCA